MTMIKTSMHLLSIQWIVMNNLHMFISFILGIFAYFSLTCRVGRESLTVSRVPFSVICLMVLIREYHIKDGRSVFSLNSKEKTFLLQELFKTCQIMCWTKSRHEARDFIYLRRLCRPSTESVQYSSLHIKTQME